MFGLLALAGVASLVEYCATATAVITLVKLVLDTTEVAQRVDEKRKKPDAN